MKKMTTEEMEKVTGGIVVPKPGTTKEDQEAMVRRHFLQKRRYGWTADQAIDDEIMFNKEISNSFLTDNDIRLIAAEIFS